MTAPAAAFKRVLAAVDPFDDLAPKVLRAAKATAAAHGARLSVISVVNNPQIDRAASPVAFTAFEAVTQTEEDFLEAKRLLSELVKREAPEAQFEAVRGAATDVVLRGAAEIGADLIVMGTHQKSFWEKLVLGSLSADVANRTQAAVLLVPP